MSVYYREKPEYLIECFESLLNQTVKANEWVIVEDGKLTNELYNVLDNYQNKYPELIKRVPLEKNLGLGLALREGVINCENELIARMDTDDIARKDRFEKQVKFMQLNPDIDIVGSQIKEFEGTIDNIISIRKVPLSDKEIKEYQKRRSAFNHMTVMYRKSSVIKAGNYKHCPLMEDDMLWVDLILSGAKCANLDEVLVYARTGKAMIERRGGFSYLKKYCSGRKMILNTGYISFFDYLKTICIQTIVALMPKKIRLFIFITLLRKY